MGKSYLWRSTIRPKLFSRFCRASGTKNRLKEVSGLGRNCMMFDTVRFWAYEAIRAFISGSPDSWYAEVLKVAINANGAF